MAQSSALSIYLLLIPKHFLNMVFTSIMFRAQGAQFVLNNFTPEVPYITKAEGEDGVVRLPTTNDYVCMDMPVTRIEA